MCKTRHGSCICCCECPLTLVDCSVGCQPKTVTPGKEDTITYKERKQTLYKFIIKPERCADDKKQHNIMTKVLKINTVSQKCAFTLEHRKTGVRLQEPRYEELYEQWAIKKKPIPLAKVKAFMVCKMHKTRTHQKKYK